jgi:hypothetical protein
VFLLLHLEHRPILEAPLHDVRLFVGTLDELALGDGRPAEKDVSLISIPHHADLHLQFREVLKLDVVPDMGEWSTNDGGFDHVRGSWDSSGSHGDLLLD